MKKMMIVGGMAAAMAILAKRCIAKCDFEQIIERMPENAPPKWMFRNISAIRKNSERILELVESGRMPAES